MSIHGFGKTSVFIFQLPEAIPVHNCADLEIIVLSVQPNAFVPATAKFTEVPAVTVIEEAC